MLTEEQVKRIFASMLSEALELSVQKARCVITKAGIDLSAVEDYDRRPPLESAAAKNFSALGLNDKFRTARIMVQELTAMSSDKAEKIHKRLEDLGFMFVEGEFVAINLLASPDQ